MYINTVTDGEYAKNMALRAAMYEYCRDQAQELLRAWNLEATKTTQYNTYVYLQTKLYQDIQVVTSYARAVLQDETISIDTIIQDLKSTDPVIYYFYNTLPQRYNDLTNIHGMILVQTWMQKYFGANMRYPESIDELIENRFIYRQDISTLKVIKDNIYFVPHNYPYIAPIYPSSVLAKAYELKQSWYILAIQVDHVPNANFFTRDENSMMIMMRTTDFIWRQQKISGKQRSGEIWWRVVIVKAK